MGHDIGSKCYVSSKYVIEQLELLTWFSNSLSLYHTLSFLIKVALHLSKSSVMESNQKVELELINMAIQRLVEEKKIKEASSIDCLDDQLLLSKLLSQVYLILHLLSLFLSFSLFIVKFIY